MNFSFLRAYALVGIPIHMHCAWLLILLICSVVSAQSPDVHSKILRNVEEREYALAIADLKSLAEREPKLFTERNYDYLHGRLCERTGDLQCAAASFAKTAMLNPVR